MDPLSASASILTLLAAITSAVRSAKVFMDAPNDAQALLNELADVQLVVANIESFLADLDPSRFTKSWTTMQSLQALAMKLDFGSQLVQELRGMVDQCLIKETRDQKPTVASRLSWLRIRSKVKDLSAQLTAVRQDLYNSHGFIVSSCIQIDLKSVTHGIIGMQGSNVEVLERLRGVEQSLSQMHEYQKRLMSVDQGCLQVTHGALSLSKPQLLPSPGAINQYGLEKSVTVDSGPVEISAEYWGARSLHTCTCICHRESHDAFQGLLGSLFVGYKGLPAMQKLCPRQCCQRRYSSRLSITYYFPQWFFLQRAFSMAMQTSPTAGFQIKLSFPRVVSPLATVFFVASFGTPADLRSLFDNGLASPSDINANTGATPLHAAQAYNNAATYRFLKELSASLVDVVDHYGYSASALLWDSINCGRIPKDNPLQQLCTTSITDEQLQERQFSDLHKSVIRMHKTTVQEEIYKLKTSGNHIDDTDDGGETALHWAAGRNDREAVKLLLMNGADVNKPSARGRRPLDQAASFCPDSEYVHAENVLFLLDHIDLSLRDKTGRTALFHAALWNNVAAMMILIDHNIDIDVQDHSGYTALAVAIHYNHHDAVKLLLELKADHTTVTNQTLLDAKLRDIDVELLDKDGYTAEDLFLYQRSKPRSAAEAEEIRDFLDSFRSWGEASINEWEDALEFQGAEVV
ncbi:hypothetical protein E8E12_009291 [Didymella heteroderae]|uniref:Fungal N-terminal domain-containing protein n=1 Tax=Didymella heteroderae TaxID=1769908 RepID=A0A9P4WTT5_9PLEO|nr:hypothetical protein E8E12_009291 [Didymella heteroderae]